MHLLSHNNLPFSRVARMVLLANDLMTRQGREFGVPPEHIRWNIAAYPYLLMY
jgi:hypothetical protein